MQSTIYKYIYMKRYNNLILFSYLWHFTDSKFYDQLFKDQNLVQYCTSKKCYG